MSSDRRIPALAAVIMALASGACVSRQGATPPDFPAGGLLSLSKPLPDATLLSVLEGVYDTDSRFGSNVVVHASTWGTADDVQGTVAILAFDHYAFSLMQPGCWSDPSTSPATTRLVLEGYWRYLDDPDPSPATTGLVRLFVQPQSVVDYLCAPASGPAPAPGTATLVGATGAGQNAPGLPLTVTYLRPRKSKNGPDGRQRFFVGVHHGGCQTTDNCGISENTPETFILAKKLGGDYLEIDVRLTADKVPVFFHLGLTPSVAQGAYCTGMVEDYTYDQLLANCRLRNGEVIPRVADMLQYGFQRTDLPVYLDMKTADAVVPTSQVLGQLAQKLVPCAVGATPPAGKLCLFPGSADVMTRSIMGLPGPEQISAYQAAQAATDPAQQLAPGQRCLIEEDPNDVTSLPCVAWMPRYTRGPMTSTVQSLQSQGKFVGYWTINDPATIDAFLTTAAPNGILTNYLGLLNQRWEAVGILPPYSLGTDVPQ